MEGKGESGFSGNCPRPPDTLVHDATFWHLLHLWLHVSPLPNYILGLLRAKTMFYTYHDLTFGLSGIVVFQIFS